MSHEGDDDDDRHCDRGDELDFRTSAPNSIQYDRLKSLVFISPTA